VRRLLYVPIVHEGADLGSAGPAVERGSSAWAGAERWARHQEVVRQLWEQVDAHLRAFDPRRLALYQDGLPAEGAAGRRIVEEAARRGSANYRLILRLLEDGARLVKTEAPELLLEEHSRSMSAQRGGRREESDDLLERRDAFIAATINNTLRDDEIGVLFIGAQHRVAPGLAVDIAIEMAKDPRRIQRYMAAVVMGGDPLGFEALAAYVAAPADPTPGGSATSLH
jgi:hypothetical protein